LNEIDSALAQALQALSPQDRETLFLLAWEDLTPSQAAKVVGITATAFRVRLLRARRRLRARLEETAVAAERRPGQINQLDVEGT
jgi:RNA polymerase sigma-70 factor (ECF subfamily)